MIPPRATADSPNALAGHLGMSSALAKGSLPASTRERIALAAAPINGCDYCLSAHSYLAKNSAKLDEAEIAANRHDRSCDSKADAAVRFPVKTARERDHASDSDLQAVHMDGYDDAQIAAIRLVTHGQRNIGTAVKPPPATTLYCVEISPTETPCRTI